MGTPAARTRPAPSKRPPPKAAPRAAPRGAGGRNARGGGKSGKSDGKAEPRKDRKAKVREGFDAVSPLFVIGAICFAIAFYTWGSYSDVGSHYYAIWLIALILGSISIFGGILGAVIPEETTITVIGGPTASVTPEGSETRPSGSQGGSSSSGVGIASGGGGGTMASTTPKTLEAGSKSMEIDGIENKLSIDAKLGGGSLGAPPKTEKKKEEKKEGEGGSEGGKGSAKARDRKVSSIFPFSAVVGQEQVKLALMLNVVDQFIGGVLLSGQKGTAKSVVVRGLIEVTSQVDVVQGCRFNCDPHNSTTWCFECQDRFHGTPPDKVPFFSRPIKVVDLPLNATEDRVVGTLDVGKVLTEGVFKFEQGVLAEANRGILYIDEINLLDNNVVDVMMDAAAMGVVTVEREGISIRYPARFVMVGTMNPEEGGLRPQLLDRIAMLVNVVAVPDIDLRIEIIRRRKEFEKDPEALRTRFEPEQDKLREKLAQAKALLPKVDLPRNIFAAIPAVTSGFGVDGHRADIMIEKACRALAAWEGRSAVNAEDVITIASMVLPHRMRKKPFEEGEFSINRVRTIVEEAVTKASSKPAGATP